MTKKTVAQPQDKYVLRMPDGLRGRIKAYAERIGTSINSEIVRVLEREYPYQPPVDARLSELFELMDVLRAGNAADTRINDFVDKITETIVDIVSGRVTGVDAEAREAIAKAWHDYRARIDEEAVDNFLAEFNEDEARSMEATGTTAKYAIPPAIRKELGNPTDQQLEMYKLGYMAAKEDQRRSEDLDDADVPRKT